MLPTIRGVPRAVQRALINIPALLLASPELDADVERRARWLKWGLEGNDPARLGELSQRVA